MIDQVKQHTDRVVHGFEKLSENLEAYISGEREVAVACMVDTPAYDRPSISRVKADTSLVYTMSATDIAMRVGLSVADTSYLLSNANGLNWLQRKRELWNSDLYVK